VPLVTLAYGRSGDKGDLSNIGIMARHERFLPVLRAQLTDEAVRSYLSHLVNGAVTRYELPGIGAFNVVCEEALGGGGMASLRTDPLGKAMAQPALDAGAGRQRTANGTVFRNFKWCQLARMVRLTARCCFRPFWRPRLFLIWGPGASILEADLEAYGSAATIDPAFIPRWFRRV